MSDATKVIITLAAMAGLCIALRPGTDATELRVVAEPNTAMEMMVWVRREIAKSEQRQGQIRKKLLADLARRAEAYVAEHTADVYRFWSPKYQSHFYTTDPNDRDKLIHTYGHVWTYEGVTGSWWTEDGGNQ